MRYCWSSCENKETWVLDVGGMGLKIVICDDIKEDAMATVDCLKAYYAQHPGPKPQVTIVSNGEKLRKIQEIDILFLDIELRNESGIELAAEFNRISPKTMVVFVSSFPFYVTVAFNVNASQFFVKPLQYEVFQREYDRLLKRYEALQDTFTRKIGHDEVEFHKADIVYIESRKRILIVYTSDGKSQQYYGKIGDEEQFFASTNIIRCHRGFLVNLAHAVHVDRNGITVKFADGKTELLPVGDTWYEAARTKFLHYVSRK